MFEIRYDLYVRGNIMRLVENKKLNERYYFEVLENGLKVYLMPKKDFHKTYAIFSTKYGSRDIEFIPIGKKDYIKTPEGIAHFLEHKLFENEDGTDASNLFAALGAEVNAFTTNYQTAYLFSTTSDVEKNVILLLDFVQKPYFNKEGIEKERGIIEQELLMYLDQPQNIQYYGILKGLYKYNNIRNEIGGTIDSIKQINEDLLYTCYQTFYQPNNMTLAIVGNFDLDIILQLIKENQAKKIFPKPSNINRKYYIEDVTVNEENSFIEMSVNSPKVSVGLKFPCEKNTPQEFLKKFISLEILVDLYFSESSNYYEELINKNIINNSFEYALYYDETYGHLLFNLDTENPESFISKIREIINIIKINDIDEKDFVRTKKLYLSRTIRRFNSLEYIVNYMIESDLDQLTIFDAIDILESIKCEDIKNQRKYFNINSVATFTIFPKK